MSLELQKLLSQKLGLDQETIQKAIDQSQKNGLLLHSVIESMKITTNPKILDTFASIYGVNKIHLEAADISPEIIKLLPKKLAEDFKVVPIDRAGNNLMVAMVNPKDIKAHEQIRFQTGYYPKPVFALESDVKFALQKYYQSIKIEMEAAPKADSTSAGQATQDITTEKPISSDRVTITDRKTDDRTVNLVSETLIQCINRKASDIHIEPYEESMRIRLRIDGILIEVSNLQKHFKDKITARVKILAKMKIDETRLPQDGAIQIHYNGKDIDFRVSSLPCLYGEKIVMRILDKSSLEVDMEKLGFEPEQLKNFKDNIYRPNGMVLVTGPTGSGKTTTLYSALQELNDDETNIMTAEDPVEFALPGVNQVNMKSSIGLNFASALKAFLRQDPDVILVGEIRDKETAEIAVKAALTGHMVLSTLHTNSAVDTIARLINMEIEPFNLVASLNCVVAQRLMRKICENCREVDPEGTPERLISIGVAESWAHQYKAYKGKGCTSCNKSGMKGRVAVHEVLVLNDEIKKCIIKGGSSIELKQAAIRSGMVTLRQSGIIKILKGISPISEVIRVTDSDSIQENQNVA